MEKDSYQGLERKQCFIMEIASTNVGNIFANHHRLPHGYGDKVLIEDFKSPYKKEEKKKKERGKRKQNQVKSTAPPKSNM